MIPIIIILSICRESKFSNIFQPRKNTTFPHYVAKLAIQEYMIFI